MTPREAIESARAPKTLANYTIGDEIVCTPLLADAILRALDAAGFQVVPKEPTQAMAEAGEVGDFHDGDGALRGPDYQERCREQAVIVYRAMLAAAQKEGEG